MDEAELYGIAGASDQVLLVPDYSMLPDAINELLSKSCPTPRPSGE